MRIRKIMKKADGARGRRQALRAGLLPLFFLTVLLLAGCYPAVYQPVSGPVPADSGAAARARMTQLYFYPKMGQSQERQSRDHYECYNWAVQQTHFDPSRSQVPPVQRVRVVPMPPPGHDTAVLAVAGAVLGALIGGPRHAGEGALIGAAGGAFTGAVSDASRQQYAQQMEEAYARRDRTLDVQYHAKELDFRRAMSACLEGRGYSVQ
ncbi:MAG: hypothetical protein A4E68_00787 [Syntrophaceae bacterium PtaB.Bin095]|jgi:hypothetical protein|nr:MAG: hypothetical protein A4E68_00787 [Syntrophaceae bacterium PtaB.Bin095]